MRELHEGLGFRFGRRVAGGTRSVRMMQTRSMAALRAARAAPPIPAVDLMHLFLLWRRRASPGQPNFLRLRMPADFLPAPRTAWKILDVASL